MAIIVRGSASPEQHVEFGALDKPLPEGDVLLLAGDTTVLSHLGKHRQDAASRSVKKSTKRLNDEISAKFKRAYAVIGNHEARSTTRQAMRSPRLSRTSRCWIASTSCSPTT